MQQRLAPKNALRILNQWIIASAPGRSVPKHGFVPFADKEVLSNIEEEALVEFTDIVREISADGHADSKDPPVEVETSGDEQSGSSIYDSPRYI